MTHFSSMVRHVLPLLIVGSISTSVFPHKVCADLLYESATTLFEGPAGSSIGGISTNQNFYSGVYFEIDGTVLIDRYGGHFGQLGTSGNRMIFGAIVRVNSFGEVPDLDNNAMDVGLIELPADGTTQNVHSSTTLVLRSGIYALVFGNGRFGAGDNTVAALSNQFGPVNQGIDITFAWRQSDNVIINQSPGARYFVEGIHIPEPNSIWLVMGFVLVSKMRRRR